jgi:methylated-DNA-[protein]-cysteine S-methyltransferase
MARARQILKAYYDSPIGTIEMIGTKEAVLALCFVEGERPGRPRIGGAVSECVRQIDAYFRGTGKNFSDRLAIRGTAFQQAVWREVQNIPFGRSASYRQIAELLGKPTAFRAVGHANGKNPVPIVIPCHRVIASDGSLTGDGGGLWRKRWLLEHERCHAQGARLHFAGCEVTLISE